MPWCTGVHADRALKPKRYINKHISLNRKKGREGQAGELVGPLKFFLNKPQESSQEPGVVAHCNAGILVISAGVAGREGLRMGWCSLSA